MKVVCIGCGKEFCIPKDDIVVSRICQRCYLNVTQGEFAPPRKPSYTGSGGQ